MSQKLTVAVRDSPTIEPAETYEEADSRYLFVQPSLGMFLNTVYTGKEMTTHVHPHYHQFVYFVEGEGVGDIDGQQFPLRPGISVRIPAGVPHSWRCTSQRDLKYVELKVPIGPDVDLQDHIEQMMPHVNPQRLGIDVS